MRKLNEKLISQLRNGEIVLKNQNGSHEELSTILRAAFPKDRCNPYSKYKEFIRMCVTGNIDRWDSTTHSYVGYPKYSILEFFIKEEILTLILTQ